MNNLNELIIQTAGDGNLGQMKRWLDIAGDGYDMTDALKRACYKDKLRTVKELVRRGAVADGDSSSPVATAIRWGSLRVVKYLYRHIDGKFPCLDIRILAGACTADMFKYVMARSNYSQEDLDAGLAGVLAAANAKGGPEHRRYAAAAECLIRNGARVKTQKRT